MYDNRESENGDDSNSICEKGIAFCYIFEWIWTKFWIFFTFNLIDSANEDEAIASMYVHFRKNSPPISLNFTYLNCVFFVSNIFSDSDSGEFDDVLSLDGDGIGPTNADVCGVFKKVASYMKIVEKTTVHMVPKAITLYIIREVEKFINTDLLVKIVNDIDENDVRFFLCLFYFHTLTLICH